MKKIALLLMVVSMLMVFNPLQSNATTTIANSSLADPTASKSLEANVLILRLNEINSMDKTNLKSSEKKILRKEVRSIKHELQTMHSGVYVSVGAIIIIALLLILLL
jgi:hypothetical protein